MRYTKSILFTLLAVFLLASLPVQAQQASESGSAVQEAPKKVDLNTAPAEALQEIPGIGPKMAQRILDFRTENGPFKKIEDLMNVKGIGEKKFERIRSWLTLTSK